MSAEDKELFRIITPSDPSQRGAQLSVMLARGILDTIMKELELRGVIIDERKPDVIRVAPAPLYNTFSDCVSFIEAFSAALQACRTSRSRERGEDV
jgi:kynureninase